MYSESKTTEPIWAFTKKEIEEHANGFADFLWRASGETGHSDVWRGWVVNELQLLMEAVQNKIGEKK